MSPPDTNIRKQKRRHWPVFWGIVGAIALAIAAWFILHGIMADTPEPAPPGTAETDAAE